MALIDKASLLMVPSTYEAGTLYNVLPSGNRAPDSTDQNSGYDQTRADFTFDRGSNAAATRVNSDGLIEKYRENLFTQSNNFSDSDWNVKAGTFTQGVEDPDGGNNAWAWTATNTDPYLYQSGKSTTGVSTLSIWVKGVGSTIGASFQIRTGAAPYKNLTLTGDWQRVEHFNNTASGTSVGFEYGNPAVVGDVVHIYQAQYEVGTIATDYLDSGATTAKAGVLIDLPRINYDANGENGALLLEPQRQNKIQYSEYFGDSSWNNSNEVTRSISEATSPEGVLNAYDIIPTTANTNHTLRAPNLSGFTSGAVVNVSFFAKENGYKFISVVGGFGSSNTPAVVFNLEDGTIESGTGTIEDFGNGWYRCVSPITLNATALYCVGTILNDSQSGSFSGDGVKGISVYGYQIEEATYQSSYIPNHGTSGGVTRAADSCSTIVSQLTGTGYTATLLIEFDGPLEPSATDLFKWQPSADVSTRFWIYTTAVGIAGGGAYGFNKNNAKHKFVFRVSDSTTRSIFYNGTKVVNTTGVAAGSGYDKIEIQDANALQSFNVSKITGFTEALSDAECITLTTL